MWWGVNFLCRVGLWVVCFSMAVITAGEISDSLVYLPFTTERVAVTAFPAERGIFLQLVLRLPMSGYRLSRPVDSPKHDENWWYRVYPFGGHLVLKSFREAVGARKAQKRLAALVKLAKVVDERLEENWAVSLVDKVDEWNGITYPRLLFVPPGGRAPHRVGVTLLPNSLSSCRTKISFITKELTSEAAVNAAVTVDSLLGQDAVMSHKLLRNGQLTEQLIAEHRREQERELLSAAIAMHPEMEVKQLLDLVGVARAFVDRGVERALSEGKKQLSMQSELA